MFEKTFMLVFQLSPRRPLHSHEVPIIDNRKKFNAFTNAIGTADTNDSTDFVKHLAGSLP